MCRWLAYSGSPLLIEDLLYKPAHSLIAQSLHSTLGAEATNGDGFGIGWYGAGETPGVFHSIEPAWNDRNLRERRATSSHRSSSPTSAPRPARRSSRRTATRSATAAGSGCTTGSSASSPGQARPRARGRPVPLPGHRGLDRLRGVLLPGPHARARGRPARRRRARGRPHRGDRAAARRRAPDPDDGGDDRRDRALGVPLLERGPVALALLLDGRDDAQAPVSRQPGAAPAFGRVQAGRLGAAGRPRRAWNEVPESSYGVIREGQDELRPFTPRPAASARA